jgi:hypothetical protein
MKPLGEWTDDELRDDLCATAPAELLLDELLRRERARAADVILERGVAKFAGVANLYILSWSQDVAKRVMDGGGSTNQ